jgi:serine protease Do
MESLVIARAPQSALRKSALGALLVAGAVAVAPAMTPAPAFARLAPEGFADLVEQVSPAVVQITAKQIVSPAGSSEMDEHSLPEHFRDGPFKDFFDRYFKDRTPQEFQGPRAERGAMGSGFIVDDSGIVVTNNHVVGNAKEITVTLKDGTEVPATLLGTDEKTDIALLRIETGKTLSAVAWADSAQTRVGDWVLAVGSPFGLGGTATVGIVSARGRDIGAGPFDDFIQVDAPINSGNSGGPLFDQNGKVIGVNTAIYSPNGGSVGIGFAIPAELAQHVVAQLRDKGKVERGWLGVRIQPVTPEIAESLGLDRPEGAMVASVNAGSPAEKSGLHQGDVILGFAGTKVETLRDLTRAAANAAIGSDARLDVWRGEKEMTLDVKIGEAPQQVAAAASDGNNGSNSHDGVELDSLGLILANLDDQTRARYGLDDTMKGVVIAGVDSNSDAAEKGLRPGDLITRINQTSVATSTDVTEAVEQAEKAKRKAVLLLVERQGEQRFVAVEIAHA